MSHLDIPANDHEFLAMQRFSNAGPTAFIAIHNRNLGPAIGGCRMFPYASMDAAITDLLRLSRGMTYKCAISAVPYGGGKAVIVADPLRDKSKCLFHAMGAFVDSLCGRYITSFDSGTTLEDVATIGERTKYIAGIADGFGNASQSTAIGVFNCIRMALEHQATDLRGARVAIQGAGSVGSRLAKLLLDAGADVIIADLDRKRAERTGAVVVAPDAIISQDADVFAPCAMGAVVNLKTIPTLKAKIIAGGANNQLSSPEDAELLRDMGVLYCPDFLVNAGGIVELHHQRSGSNYDALMEHLASLATTLSQVI